MTSGLVGLLAVASQLQSAAVRVDLTDSVATVRAEFRFEPTPDSIRFVLMRIDGQTVRFTGNPPPAIEGEGALTTVWPSPGAGVVAQYEVRGNLTRIPMLVPDVPTDPETSEVRIEVVGYSEVGTVGDAFPRFAVADGSIVARPENLPSFVLLAGPSGFATNRLASATVVFLVLGAMGVWLLGRWRRRRYGEVVT